MEMEDFRRAEQKCRCINNISGCQLLECLMCISSFLIFILMQDGSAYTSWKFRFDTVKPKGILETYSTGGGSTDIQHHSGSSLKTQAFEHQHVFHCCASTGGSSPSAALFKSARYFRLRQQFRLSKSLLSFVSGRVLACSFWSDYRRYFNMLVLTQRCFINSLAP